MSSPDDLLALSIEVCWRQWTALGVAGVKTQESASVVDPEALIVFTAGLQDADPRLRDESTDWCARYGPRFVSTSRLKNLVAQELHVDCLNDYFATVNANSSTRWPTTNSVEARTIELSRKSTLPQLRKHPALLRLQLRAMFGVTARAEVLTVFLTSRPSPEPFFSASDLELSGYSKRNIAFVLDDLAVCGLLTARRVGNQIRYRLDQRPHLTKLAPGASTASFKRWDLRFRLLTGIRRFAMKHEADSALVRSVDARKFVNVATPVLDELDLSVPAPANPEAYWNALLEWAVDNVIPQNIQ